MKKAIIFVLIFMLLTLSACWNKDELKINFGWQGTEIPSVMSAARADHSEFKTDDISLDFYFGGHVSEYSSNSDIVLVGLGLYFCNSKYFGVAVDSYITEYKNIDGLYFVRLIEGEEFNSSKYSVSQTLLTGKKFSHKERLTVPQEVIELNEGSFCILFAEIVYLNQKDTYHIFHVNYLSIGYKRIDSETVRLFDALVSPPEYPK